VSGLVSAERYLAAPDFHQYVGAGMKNVDFWRAGFRTASVHADLVQRASRLASPWHLLVLSEDWCGDAMSTVPVLAKFAEVVPGMDLRILARDENPDLIASHLTSRTRSIPVVIALDGDFVERGWWGPRPSELHRWMRTDGLHLPKDERLRRTRLWYARDRGRTTIEETLAVLERGERRRNGT
jgi:hypothetical protein